MVHCRDVTRKSFFTKVLIVLFDKCNCLLKVNSTFYCDVLRRRFESIFEENDRNFGMRRVSCCITTMRIFTIQFSCANFWQNSRTATPHTPYSLDLAPYDFGLFPYMKMKLKDCRFEKIEEIHWNRKQHPRLSQKVYMKKFCSSGKTDGTG